MTDEELEADEEDLPEGVWVEVEEVTQWFEDEAAARRAMIALGMSPGEIREALDPTPPKVWCIMVTLEGEDEITYEAHSMDEATKMALRFCTELGVDQLEAMRTLEEAAAAGEREVSVGPITIMGPE